MKFDKFHLAIDIRNVSFLGKYNLKRQNQRYQIWAGIWFWLNLCKWQAFCSLSPSLVCRVAKQFRRRRDTLQNSGVKGTQLFVRLFTVNFSCNDCWRDLHLQGSFQGTLDLDNSVCYRCNRPHLHLTEEHSIRWKFCLANQKLFHLIWSAFENLSVPTHRRRIHYLS